MWNRQEQHQAYQFLNRRIVSAVLSGEPETNELPMRRFGVALFSGIVVALLVVAGFTAFGFMFPGGGKPTENTIIEERETGALYVFVDGLLHPVANWTSARLILGQESPQTKTLSQASLRDVSRGRPVGIPDAPSTLPDKKALVGLPWSVCSAPRSADQLDVATHVLVGGTPSGGRETGDLDGLLVTTGSDRFLLWRGHRLQIPDQAALAALTWAGVQPALVSTALLNAIPAGPTLRPLDVPGAGQPTPYVVDGKPTTVGQIFQAGGETYVMVPDGLAPVGQLTAMLWANTGRPVTQTSASEVGRVLAQDASPEPADLPSQLPIVAGAGDRVAMVCTVYHGGTDVDRPVTVQSFQQRAEDVPYLDRATPSAAPLADRVSLSPGHAALVRTLVPEGSQAQGLTYVVTDQGMRYALPRVDTAAVQASLGYGGAAVQAVPAAFLDLLRTGPVLDPVAARAFLGISEPSRPPLDTTEQGRTAPDATPDTTGG
jgi:type VII secretion protein EccB